MDTIKDAWKYFSKPIMYQEGFAKLQDDIAFWTLFMALGFNDTALKESAENLYIKLQKFEDEFKAAPTSFSIKELLGLLDQEKALQKKAIALMANGQWGGWLYPSLLKHMTMELEYFSDKLKGVPFDVKKEIDFWTKEAKDKIGVMAHLFDPVGKSFSERS